MFIGEKKIKGVMDIPDEPDMVTVGFKDGLDIKINKNLLTLIQHTNKRKGNVTDAVRMVLSTKFLMEMAEYGLDFLMVSHITSGMTTLAHNTREEAVGKKFGCVGLNGISLKDLIDCE